MILRKFATAFCASTLCAVIVLAFPAHGADLLDRITAGKTITIATEARYAPFEFVQDGKIVGYDVDLMNHILQKPAGRESETARSAVSGDPAGTGRQKFDFVVTAVTVNKQRIEHFAFTVPIAESTVALLKRESDTSIASLDDLSGKVVGSQAGSGQLQILQSFNEQLKAGASPASKKSNSMCPLMKPMRIWRTSGLTASPSRWRILAR